MTKRTFSVLVALVGILIAMAGPATAKCHNGQNSPWICHPVASATGGNQHNGYDLIHPANPSIHIDESLYPNGHYWKHEFDGRHDRYAVDGGCDFGDTPPPPVDACPDLAGDQPNGTQCTPPNPKRELRWTVGEPNCDTHLVDTVYEYRTAQPVFDQSTNTWGWGEFGDWQYWYTVHVPTTDEECPAPPVTKHASFRIVSYCNTVRVEGRHNVASIARHRHGSRFVFVGHARSGAVFSNGLTKLRKVGHLKTGGGCSSSSS